MSWINGSIGNPMEFRHNSEILLNPFGANQTMEKGRAVLGDPAAAVDVGLHQGVYGPVAGNPSTPNPNVQPPNLNTPNPAFQSAMQSAQGQQQNPQQLGAILQQLMQNSQMNMPQPGR